MPHCSSGLEVYLSASPKGVCRYQHFDGSGDERSLAKRSEVEDPRTTFARSQSIYSEIIPIVPSHVSTN